VVEYIPTPDPLGEALKRLFGLNYLFPYQRLVVSNILEAAEARGIPIKWPGNTPENIPPTEFDDETDASSFSRQIVILPTGAGKSLCFQLPAMLLDGPSLVIYPILSLMADQERRLAEKGFAPVILRGGQSAEERAAIWRKLRSGESRFIIANPEVLLTEKVMAELGSLGIVHLVIDEAHCVSEWGESFRPSYLEIGKIVEAAGNPMVTAFTATASAPVLEKIEKYIFGRRKETTDFADFAESADNSGVLKIIGNPDRANITYCAVGAYLKDLAVRDLIAANERPAIVFCSSRRGTEKLARYLRNSLGETEIKFYHAGLSREEKTAVEKWFFDSPNGVLTATCAYGMGVDKSDIRTVIHRDSPPSVEAYLQESGRAGRDGKQSRAYFVWGPEDEAQVRRAKTETDRARIEALLTFARDSGRCRRERLLEMLNYDGELARVEHGCCDVCDGVASGTHREEASVMDYIHRNARVFTRREAAERIAGHCGCGTKEAAGLLAAMINEGKLRESKNWPWKGRLSCS
jgi:ATP-dependent DNA helicase RecQ